MAQAQCLQGVARKWAFTLKVSDGGSKISYTFGCSKRLKGVRTMETAVAENYDTNPAFAQGGNLDIPAFGGPMGIRWDEGARVTPRRGRWPA